MPGRDSSDQDAAIISESGAMNVFFLLDKVGLAYARCPSIIHQCAALGMRDVC
jgi:hypothetical protein